MTVVERQRKSRAKAQLVKSVPGPIEGYAELILRKAHEGVTLGTLPVSVRDGIAAQKILDLRAAKTDDRQILLAMARTLLGGNPGQGGFLAPQHLITAGDDEDDDDLIEGEAVEVDE